jgi:hypothetical protein
VSHQHITDLAAYALASAGMATAILPPDYGALGVAAIGGIIGGFLSVAIVPEAPTETRRSIGLKWAVSSMTSIAITPFLFQRLTHAVTIESGSGNVRVIEASLPNTAEAMLALSTVVAFVAWVTLRLGQAAWSRWFSGWFAGVLPPPQRRRRADRHEDGPGP